MAYTRFDRCEVPRDESSAGIPLVDGWVSWKSERVAQTAQLFAEVNRHEEDNPRNHRRFVPRVGCLRARCLGVFGPQNYHGIVPAAASRPRQIRNTHGGTCGL